jgi:hypothetical protein
MAVDAGCNSDPISGSAEIRPYTPVIFTLFRFFLAGLNLLEAPLVDNSYATALITTWS